MSFNELLLFAFPVSLFLASKWGLFAVSANSSCSGKVSAVNMSTAFLLYMAVSFISPLLIDAVGQLLDAFGVPLPASKMRSLLIQITAITIAFISLFSFSRMQMLRTAVWGSHGISHLRAFLKGVLYSLVLYPLVMIAVQFIHVFVAYFVSFTQHEQTAILQLKKSAEIPLLSAILNAQVITLVPITEEIMFRGMFQNFLVSLFGGRFGIFAASCLFAGMHYTVSQGCTNIELLSGLFLLSYSIGCTYLRERTLWAPIGMHAAFNTISLFFMYSANG